MAKMYPVQRKMNVRLTNAPSTTAIIRADRCLSVVNHRLYRQSRMYMCKIDLDSNAAQNTVVDVWALANTWWTQKAYQRAYETFLENSKEERDQMKGSVARWNDFRVDHGITADDMLPTGTTSPIAAGTSFGIANAEYLVSEVHDTAGTSRTMRWTGTGANTYNVIDEYDKMANTDNAPTSAPGQAAYSELQDEVDAGQASHLGNDGNTPPYNRLNLENYVWIKVGTLVCSHNGTDKLSTGYFEAPCGLIALTKNTPFVIDGANAVLNLEVKAGDYKGVGAPTYLDDARIYASSKKSSGASHNKRIR